MSRALRARAKVFDNARKKLRDFFARTRTSRACKKSLRGHPILVLGSYRLERDKLYWQVI